MKRRMNRESLPRLVHFSLWTRIKNLLFMRAVRVYLLALLRSSRDLFQIVRQTSSLRPPRCLTAALARPLACLPNIKSRVAA